MKPKDITKEDNQRFWDMKTIEWAPTDSVRFKEAFARLYHTKKEDK
ncbi:MAG: hypothetical protein WBC05_08665 [Sedimentisphaerales bacterium]